MTGLKMPSPSLLMTHHKGDPSYRESCTDRERGAARTAWHSTDKCQVLHLGQYNQILDRIYMVGEPLCSKGPEGLGGQADHESAVCHCSKGLNPGLNPRGITSRGRDVIIPLCSAFFRPHLQYHTQFSFPQFKKGADRPETVQRMAIKMAKVL